MANSSSAVALFAIGGMLVGLKLRGQLRDILTAVGGKLLLMPVLAVALVTLLPMLVRHADRLDAGPHRDRLAVIERLAENVRRSS